MNTYVSKVIWLAMGRFFVVKDDCEMVEWSAPVPYSCKVQVKIRSEKVSSRNCSCRPRVRHSVFKGLRAD